MRNQGEKRIKRSEILRRNRLRSHSRLRTDNLRTNLVNTENIGFQSATNEAHSNRGNMSPRNDMYMTNPIKQFRQTRIISLQVFRENISAVPSTFTSVGSTKNAISVENIISELSINEPYSVTENNVLAGVFGVDRIEQCRQNRNNRLRILRLNKAQTFKMKGIFFFKIKH